MFLFPVEDVLDCGRDIVQCVLNLLLGALIKVLDIGELMDDVSGKTTTP
jgi:hypothetical protein